jgi:hypothetical protein
MQNSKGRKEDNDNAFPEKGIALEKTGSSLTMNETHRSAIIVSRAIYTP